MSTAILETGAGSSPATRTSEHVQRHTVAGYQRELTEMRLQQALAREAALLRQRDELMRELSAWRDAAISHVAGLTPRQHQIMELVLAGHRNKNIAAALGISQRTVENHRAAIMKKTGSTCLPALARLALAVAWTDVPDPGPRLESTPSRCMPTSHTTATPVRIGAAVRPAPRDAGETNHAFGG